MESHMNSWGKAGANKHCGGARMQRKQTVCSSQCIGFYVSLLSQTHTHTKFIVPGLHFHAKSIGASPVVIAHKCKMAKLFKFLYSQTQRDCTTVQPSEQCSPPLSQHTVGSVVMAYTAWRLDTPVQISASFPISSKEKGLLSSIDTLQVHIHNVLKFILYPLGETKNILHFHSSNWL